MGRGRTWGVALVAGVLLASCASPDPDPSASPAARQDALECPDGVGQSAQVALAEGDGFPTREVAVAEAQATGWLPDGAWDLPTGSSRGLVRVGTEVVAEFTVEEVGGGLHHVTSVDTCAEG